MPLDNNVGQFVCRIKLPLRRDQCRKENPGGILSKDNTHVSMCVATHRQPVTCYRLKPVHIRGVSPQRTSVAQSLNDKSESVGAIRARRCVGKQSGTDAFVGGMDARPDSADTAASDEAQAADSGE